MRQWPPEEMEEIPCDFCGACEVKREYIRGDGMNVVECARCGLAYLNPRPKSEFIARFYDADYFTGVSADRGDGGLHCNVEQKKDNGQNKHILRTIWILENNFEGIQGKKVLEIGCATGDLLIALKERGANVKGLDISNFAADIARSRNIDVMTGNIEDIDHSEKFDIVIALQVIEHVLKPTRVFKKIARLLREGGVFILSTPNYSCVKRFGQRWYGFNASYEHLYFLNLQTLRNIGLSSDFYIKYVESSELIYPSEEKSNYFENVIQRFKTLSYVVSEIGLLRTLDNILRKSSGCHPYAIGHSITVVFEKKQR